MIQHERDDDIPVRLVRSAGPPGFVVAPTQVATCRRCGQEYLPGAVGRSRCLGARL